MHPARSPYPIGLFGFALFGGAAACAGPAQPTIPIPPAATSVVVAASATMPPKSPCERALTLRQEATAALLRGRLFHGIRMLDEVSSLCPSEWRHAREPLVAALADIGYYDRARELATALLRDGSEAERVAARAALVVVQERDRVFPDTDAAKAEMRRLYYLAADADARKDWAEANKLWLRAWGEWRPLGQALVAAGLDAQQLGDEVAAQRLFDRAIVELEKATSATLTVDVPNGFQGVPTAVEWSPNGKFLVVAHGTLVSVFDIVTMRERVRYAKHAGAVNTVSISPDGKRIASGCDEGTVREWEMSDGTERQSFEHIGRVHTVAWGKRGEWLVVDYDSQKGPYQTMRVNVPTSPGTVIWDTKTRARVMAIDHGAPTSLRLDPSGNVAYSFSLRGGITKRAIPSGKELGVQRPDYFVDYFEFAPDRRAFFYSSASPSQRGTIRARSLDTGREEVVLSSLATGHGFELTRSGEALYAVGRDGVLRAYTPRTRTIARLGASFPSEGVRAMPSPDGRRIALVDTTKRALEVVLAGETYRPGASPRVAAHAPRVTDVAVVPRQEAVLWAVAGGEIVSYDAASGIRNVSGHRADVQSLSVARDGAVYSSLSHDREVRVWDRATGAALLSMRGKSAAITPDGRLVAVGSATTLCCVDVHSIADGRKQGTLGASDPVALSPLGESFATHDGEGRVEIADLTTLTLRGRPKTLRHLPNPGYGRPYAIDYAWNGRALAVASTRPIPGNRFELAHGVSVFDLGQEERRANLGPFASPVVALALSPDGKIVAYRLGGELRAVVVDARDGRGIGALDGGGEPITQVHFAHERALLVAGTEQGSVMFFDGATVDRRLTMRAVAGTLSAYAFHPAGIEWIGPPARERAVCRVGPLSFPFALCRDRFEQTGLLRGVLQGHAPSK